MFYHIIMFDIKNVLYKETSDTVINTCLVMV